MSKLATDQASGYQPGRAPRGSALSCEGWQQEAALRMLMNNLDPEVAEKPEDLIVYGGRGKAARNWNCYHAIVASLRALENDETLLVQSGKEGTIYLLDTSNLGKYNATDKAVQELNYVMGGIWGGPAYFNNTVYFGPIYSSDRKSVV